MAIQGPQESVLAFLKVLVTFILIYPNSLLQVCKPHQAPDLVLYFAESQRPFSLAGSDRLSP